MSEFPRIIGRPADGVAADEQSHFTICPGCGARVDMRDLEQVLAHVHGADIPFTVHAEKED